jgi:tetratricopeptide (TPR) repeat protein
MKQLPSDNLETTFVEMIWKKAQNAKPTSLNQLACLCAIPHWFDTKIAQALVGFELDDSVTKLSTRYPSFIRIHPQGYTYHESIRNAFWRKWHLDDPENLIEVSDRLVRYLDHIIMALSFSERLDYEYERMYHLTTIEPDRGFEELDRLFQIAQDNHQIEACHRLVNWISEHSDYLPQKYFSLLNYYKGELARELHQSELAESIFSEILMTKNIDELIYAKTNNSMALSITSGQANINDAFPYLLASVDILRKTNNWYWLGQVLYNLSYVSRLAGRREDALSYGEEALEVLDTHSQPDNVTWLVKKSRVLSELGLVLWLLGRPEQARIRFNEALKIQLGVEAKDPAIETYANLGRLERTSGNWDEAIRQLQNSIQLATETKNQHQMAWTRNALGNVYVEMEDWASALQCFEESQRLWENIGHQHERGIPVKNIIGVYTALGKWDLAEKAVQDSINIFADHQGRQGEIYNSLGELRFAQSNFDDAKLNFDRALELASKNKDRKTEPRVHINLAELNFMIGNLILARQEAEQALQQSRDYQQLDRMAQAMMILGKIDLTEGNLEQSVAHFLSASSSARAFNPKVHEIVIIKIVHAISEMRKNQPRLDWSFFFKRIDNARNSENEIFVSTILELAK